MAQTTPPAPGNRRPNRGYWLPAVIAMIALLAIGVAAGAGDLSHPTPHNLNGADVESQIGLAVQGQRGWTTPPTVSCPASEPVRAGWHFDCSLVDGATHQTLTVTEIDDRGGLRWSVAGPGR